MKNANMGRLGGLLRDWNALSSPRNCWRGAFGELSLSLLSFRGPHTGGNPESRNKTKSFSNKQTGSQVHAWDDDDNNGFLCAPRRTLAGRALAGRQTLGNNDFMKKEGHPERAARRVSGFTSWVVSRGFTLIELLVVVLIIGILASVALPEYNKAVEKSRAAEALTVVRAIKVANEAYFMANGSYSNDLNDLDIQIPRKESSLFSFAASANVAGVGSVVASGNRFPLATQYIIFALPNRDNFYCKFYGPEGETLCKSLGRTKYSNQVYVVN